MDGTLAKFAKNEDREGAGVQGKTIQIQHTLTVLKTCKSTAGTLFNESNMQSGRPVPLESLLECTEMRATKIVTNFTPPSTKENPLTRHNKK